MSHLFGVYPGHSLTPQTTPELCKAAANSMIKRGNMAIQSQSSLLWGFGSNFLPRVFDHESGHDTVLAESQPQSVVKSHLSLFLQISTCLQISSCEFVDHVALFFYTRRNRTGLVNGVENCTLGTSLEQCTCILNGETHVPPHWCKWNTRALWWGRCLCKSLQCTPTFSDWWQLRVLEYSSLLKRSKLPKAISTVFCKFWEASHSTESWMSIFFPAKVVFLIYKANDFLLVVAGSLLQLQRCCSKVMDTTCMFFQHCLRVSGVMAL